MDFVFFFFLQISDKANVRDKITGCKLMIYEVQIIKINPDKSMEFCVDLFSQLVKKSGKLRKTLSESHYDENNWFFFLFVNLKVNNQRGIRKWC